MNMPVRCFSCNKVVGNKWYPYQYKIKHGKTPKEALDELGLTRYCCKRMVFTHVEMEDILLAYSNVQVNPKSQVALKTLDDQLNDDIVKSLDKE